MRPRWCAPQQASIAITHGARPEANLITLSRCRRRRRTTSPLLSSPTTLQLFFPRSIPKTAISIAMLLPLQLSNQHKLQDGGAGHSINLNPNVMVVKSAEHWAGVDRSIELDRTSLRSILAQRAVRSDLVVAKSVKLQHIVQPQRSDFRAPRNRPMVPLRAALLVVPRSKIRLDPAAPRSFHMDPKTGESGSDRISLPPRIG